MKKLIIITSFLLVLTGCSDAFVKVSNPSEVVFVVGTENITKGQLFNLMIKQDAGQIAINYAKEIILNQESPINDLVKEKAQTDLDYVKQLFGENFEASLKQYGFKDEQDYLEKALYPIAQQYVLAERYINDNFETIVANYYPKKVRIIEFTILEDAEDALEAIKEGQNVEDVAQQFSLSFNFFGQLELVHRESGLPTVVASYIQESSIPTLSNTPILDPSTSYYYIVQVVEAQADRFKEEAIEELSKLSSILDIIFNDLFKEGNFNVYDKEVYDSIKQSFPTYLP